MKVTRNLKYKNVGKLCAENRRGLGISQRELAKTINLSPQYISAFERGYADSLTLLMIYISLGLNIKEVEGMFIRDYEKIYHKSIT